MIEKIKQCTSFSEVGRILGYDYYNGRVKGIIVKECNKLGIDIEEQIKEYKERKVYCLECGKEITGRARFGKKFCSNSCAATYNNKLRGKKSDEERNKISQTLRRKYASGELVVHNKGKFKGIPEKVKDKKTIYKKARHRQSSERKILKYLHTCPVCNNDFYGKYRQIYCSPQCVHESSEVKEKLRQKQMEKIANGTHSGWQSRNIISFPEKFWMNVLDNNNIKYIHEDFTTKKYFLDFLIEKNGKKIDLEIDGGQHKYRKEHDAERDKYLTEVGYIVYRIDWNSVNNEKGKELMKEKIEKFIDYYNNL